MLTSLYQTQIDIMQKDYLIKKTSRDEKAILINWSLVKTLYFMRLSTVNKQSIHSVTLYTMQIYQLLYQLLQASSTATNDCDAWLHTVEAALVTIEEYAAQEEIKMIITSVNKQE